MSQKAVVLDLFPSSDGNVLCAYSEHNAYNPDDGGSMLLWNVGQYLPYHKTLHPRRQQPS
jgi:hypothetical protein